MTTRREYAISLGLAKQGRGRLSHEAHAAIAKAESEGMTFSDSPKPKTVTPSASIQTIVDKPKVKETVKRYVRSYILTTKAGQVIEFGSCAMCKNSIMFCACQNGPYYPDWIKDEVETWQPSNNVLELEA